MDAIALTDLVLFVLAGALGLAIGSFLNVIAWRLPRGGSVVRPASRCPHCATPIAARDNVPVVSWLLLGGRCRACGGAISWRYPLVEATTGALFVLVVLRFGPTLAAAAGCALVALLVVLTAIDVEHLLLPDVLTLGGTALGLLFRAAESARLVLAGVPWRHALAPLARGLLGAAVGGVALLAVIYAWYAIRREWGMGLGDVKMLAMLGAFTGLGGMIVSLFVGALAGALFGLVLLATGSGGMKTRLPFGAFLALGGVVALFAGDRLVRAYLQLLAF